MLDKNLVQAFTLGISNYGRGSALDVTLALPVPFQMFSGPEGSFDLARGRARDDRGHGAHDARSVSRADGLRL
jgi:hypothetical protein